MTRDDLVRWLTERVDAATRAAVEALVNRAWQEAADWWSHDESRARGAPSALAINTYLRGSAFSSLARAQVVAWAMEKLHAADNVEAATVVQSAVIAGGGDPERALRSMVRHLATAEFGARIDGTPPGTSA